jgi:hypothetical protein
MSNVYAVPEAECEEAWRRYTHNKPVPKRPRDPGYLDYCQWREAFCWGWMSGRGIPAENGPPDWAWNVPMLV